MSPGFNPWFRIVGLSALWSYPYKATPKKRTGMVSRERKRHTVKANKPFCLGNPDFPVSPFETFLVPA